MEGDTNPARRLFGIESVLEDVGKLLELANDNIIKFY